MELALPNDREIHGAVSSNTSSSLGPTTSKSNHQGQPGPSKDEDFHKAEEFVQLMRVLYTSTLCVSCEKNATCGQIIPILQKLEEHFTMKDEDTMFVGSIKEKVWENLSQRYQDDDIQAFLHEGHSNGPQI